MCAYIAGQSACGRRDGSNDKGYCRPRLKHRTAFGVEGIVSKRVDAPYRSGPHSAWIKVRASRCSGTAAPLKRPQF